MICSPSHIRNIVPVTSVIQAVMRKLGPGFTTRPAWFCSHEAAATDWKLASATVPQRVYLMIARRPCSPSFLSCCRLGTIWLAICMMIDDEMYGMMPSANSPKRDNAPPENRLKRPSRLPDC